MTVVYNENDEFAAQWLRTLIARGLIAPGDVDTRSIVDVKPDDYRRYRQVHLFAGIGGWSLAARIAGWPDDKPLWTGSCPCQPFSAAGKRKGTSDARHLWPEMRRLVAARRPDVVVGEQVASKDGRVWLAGVRADLEALAYASWSVDACSAGVGAPHIRQRIWWLANANGGLTRHGGLQPGRQHGQQPQDGVFGGLADDDDRRQQGLAHGGLQRQQVHDADGRGAIDGLADAGGAGRRALQRPSGTDGRSSVEPDGLGVFDGLEHAASDGRQQRRTEPGGRGSAGGCSNDPLGLVDAQQQGLERHAGYGHNSGQPRWLDADSARPVAPAGSLGFWSDYYVIPCSDGKARRVGTGIQPLAHGVSARVGKLRGAGNAINPWLAAQVLGAYLDGPGV